MSTTVDAKPELDGGALCAICNKPASCLGQYDTMTSPSYACDDCCGHGCEDGWCWSMSEIPEHVGNLLTQLRESDES